EDPLDRTAVRALGAAAVVEGVRALAARLGERRAARERRAHRLIDLGRPVVAIDDPRGPRQLAEDREALRGRVVDRRRPVHRDDLPVTVDHRGELADREAARLAPGAADLELLGDPGMAAVLADRDRLGLDGEATG